MRYQKHNPCGECFKFSSHCKDAHQCDGIRKPLRSYYGIRLTADGFDCALPVTIDSHSKCSYNCIYCFSDNITGHREHTEDVGQTRLNILEQIFSGNSDSPKVKLFRKALRYDAKRNGYPCPVQLGGLCDPCDNIERNQGWLLDFIKLAIKYRQPVRMSTKGVIFLVDEYLNELKKAPELFWVAFSMVSPDDDLMKLIDVGAPLPSERIRCMKALSDIGVKTSLRFRPMLPHVSDKTAKYPHAYRTLIEMSADAGAKAISYECAFYPSAIPKEKKDQWQAMERITGVPLKKVYQSFGKFMACQRPSYLWTEGIMHAVKEEAVKNGLQVGVSDPVWKQLTEAGCCCGIMPDDPVFGNWEIENATNALLIGKRTGNPITIEQVMPRWADECLSVNMIAHSAGATGMYRRRHETWGDLIRKNWNSTATQRCVMNYFQGALQITGKDKNGNNIYKYKGLERKHLKAPFWSV